MINKLRTGCLIFGSLMMCSFAQSAHAQNVRAADPNSLAEAIKELGYRAALDKDNGGDPMISSATEGSDFEIFFYGCEKSKNCEWVDFHKEYKLNKEQFVKARNAVEEWNKNSNFSTAFIDDETIGLSYKLVLNYEMTKDLFKANFETWIISYSLFRRTINENLKKD